MPIITVEKEYFCKLIGKDMSIQEIEERIPMLGVGWEGKDGDKFYVEVFPNRPDMLSVEGLARSFSSFIGVKTGLRKYVAKPSEYLVKVDSKVSKIRPYFVSCVICDIDFTDEFIRSVMQLQEKLHITHCRKRRKVAIGLHDLDKITFPVVYTTKTPDFKFVPLEQVREMSLEEILKELPKGREYGWILEGAKEYPLLHDARGVVLSMPPIINSEDTKIEESTRNVFVDITATDRKAANEVLNIIATTFAERGAVLYKVKIKYPEGIVHTPVLETRSMSLNPGYVNGLLGLNLKNHEIIELLKRMGFDGLEISKDKLEVIVPCYRSDIMHPIDLVEDVAIAYGYEKFEPEIPNIATMGEEEPLEIFSERLRNLLVGYGLQEVMTFILTNKENLFTKMNMKERPVAEIANSKTTEYSVVRNWLLPSLMEVLSRNKHHEYPQNLFEVGDVVILDPSDETGARTRRRLAIVLCYSKANFSEMKSMVESILKNLGIEGYEIEAFECPCYIPGRAAKFTIDGKTLANFGEVHPSVLEKWGLEMPVTAAEMSVDILFEIIEKSKMKSRD